MLALPVRLGGLGIYNPNVCTEIFFHSSEKLTASLVVTQKIEQDVDISEIGLLSNQFGSPTVSESESFKNL